MPEDLTVLACDVRQDHPHLAYIQYHTGVHQGRRSQTRLLQSFFLDLTRSQSEIGGDVLLERRGCGVPVREEIIKSHFCGRASKLARVAGASSNAAPSSADNVHANSATIEDGPTEAAMPQKEGLQCEGAHGSMVRVSCCGR